MRAVFIHGVGTQGPDFAHEARRHLRAAIGKPFEATSIHWAPLADVHEKAFLASVERKGSSGGPLQRLSATVLADAILYATSEAFRKDVFNELDMRVPENATIFAHSLGGLIASDWMRLRNRPAHLVTLGCNLGLFYLDRRFPPVPALSWLNLFHKRDMLGFPLAVRPELARVRDVRVNLGGLFRGWTGLSHLLYWDDATLWGKTIPSLLR